MYQLVKEEWIESERGWGIRSDGYSLHLSLEDMQRFNDDYWDNMPDEIPDEYSRPDRHDYIYVDKKLYSQVKSSKFGMRFYK